MTIIQRYGLISGLMWANFPILLHYSGAGEKANYFFLPILGLYIFFLYMGIRQRKNDLKGYLDQRDGIRIGLGISLISGLMCGIAVFILYKYVEVLDFQTVKAQLLKDPEKIRDIAPEDLDDQIRSYIAWKRPLSGAFRISSIVIMLGGIISVVIALLLRSSKTREE